MEIERALAFVAERKQPGTLITLHGDGQPHASIVTAAVVEGRLWISSTHGRVKTRNVRGDPRVAFVVGTGPWVAIEGSAVIDDGDGVLDRLRLYYRTASGEHPDWNEYDEAMIRDRRLIIDVTPSRAYGLGV